MPTTSMPGPSLAPQHLRPTTGPIVVALDGADGARAIEAAALLARRSGAGVVALSVVEPPAPTTVGIDGGVAWSPDRELLIAVRRERIERQLRDALGQSVGDAPSWPVEVVVDEPAHAIAEEARRRRASLVVMGIGRHDLVARLFGSETTVRAVRRARTPVLAVTEAPLRVPARVAVAAIDFSPSSVAAARAALDLLGDGGTLHLVHVWARNVVDHPAALAQEDAYERALPARFAQVEAALGDRARDVAIVATSLDGGAAERIVAFARSHDADVVAAGRQGHGLLERLLVGRVTTGLLRGAPCAVLVTPEPSVVERAALERALTGTSESLAPDEWPALLDAFTRRNRGRRTALEVDDPALGAQAQETGYVLRGATYDRHDGRVELMLGTGPGETAHLTRMIDGVGAIAVHGEPGGRDAALRVAHGDGQTLLTFLPEPDADR